MEGLSQIFQELPNPKLAAQQLIDKFGVPDVKNLNTLTRLHQVMSEFSIE